MESAIRQPLRQPVQQFNLDAGSQCLALHLADVAIRDGEKEIALQSIKKSWYVVGRA
jgi:hypothetical protein